MSRTEHEVCLLLGSNIRPEYYMPLAVDLLREQVRVLRASSVWETTAVGSDGPNFLNAAVLVSTPLDMAALKENILHPIEARLGRVRTPDKNAARTMDIDVIFFDGRQVDAQLSNYAFRAVPVAQILPDHPSDQGESLKEIAGRLSKPGRLMLRPDVSIAQGTQYG